MVVQPQVRIAETKAMSRKTLRMLGIVFGVGVHILFLYTVWKLVPFLYGTPHPRGSLWVDVFLAAQFAISHSFLLLPSVRQRICRHLSPAMYGCFFCLATCLSLLLTFYGWRSAGTLWELHGAAKIIVTLACGFCWLALVYSLSLTGLGYQTGLTPWLYWLRREKPPRREFCTRGAYRWTRHPAYLSFLGLIWLTPHLTYDRCVLTAIWTVYIFIGSYLKDERLAFYIGQHYRVYQSQVRGFPFIAWGPLARRQEISQPSPSPSHAARRVA